MSVSQQPLRLAKLRYCCCPSCLLVSNAPCYCSALIYEPETHILTNSMEIRTKKIDNIFSRHSQFSSFKPLLQESSQVKRCFFRNPFSSLLTFSLEIILSPPRRQGCAPVATSDIWVFTQSFPGAGRQAVTQVKSRGFKGAGVNVSFRHFLFK